MRRTLLALGAACAAFAAVAGWWRLRSFVSDDPRFCSSCHKISAEFTLWSGDGHGRIACQKCHHTTPEQGLTLLRGFLGGGSPAAPHAPVELGSCAACHVSHDKQWIDVGASRGHRIHAVEQKIACVKCHGGGVHRFEPSAESCRGCHGEHAVRAAGMQQLHCFACHDFLSVAATLLPTRRDCLRCHQARGVHPARFPEGAPMRFACSACHKPHAPSGQERVGCGACHSRIAAAGLHAAHPGCRQCHRAHLWRSEVGDCLRCHRDAATHDPTFTCSSCHAWRAARAGGNLPRGK